MNIAPEILNFLAEKREFSEIILAPKASPVERRDRVIRRIMDVILSPEDIRETLVSLRSHTASSLGSLGREGFFSFGLPNVGRIRVTYITQRGSYVVSIIKVPYDIPPLGEIVANPDEAKELIRKVEEGGRIVGIVSRSFVVHNLFSYSLLNEICSRRSWLIYILERPITYLMKHSSSIVIQREVGVDVNSFEEGVEEALFLNPEIIYVSDIAVKGALTSIRKLLDVPILTLFSLTASDTKSLRRTLEVYLAEYAEEIWDLISLVVELELNEEGKISFSVREL